MEIAVNSPPSLHGLGGKLVILCGLPGSGKTTFAKRIVKETNAIRLCPDEWMSTLHFDLFDSEARMRVEQLQWEIAQRLLCIGQTVVLEWGTWLASERKALRHAAHERGATAELYVLEESLEILWKRICLRSADERFGSRSITRAELDNWATMFEPPDEVERTEFDAQTLSQFL